METYKSQVYYKEKNGVWLASSRVALRPSFKTKNQLIRAVNAILGLLYNVSGVFE